MVTVILLAKAITLASQEDVPRQAGKDLNLDELSIIE